MKDPKKAENKAKLAPDYTKEGGSFSGRKEDNEKREKPKKDEKEGE